MAAFDFTGKSVFIAGGTNGINLGIAEAFADAGAKLAGAQSLSRTGRQCGPTAAWQSRG